MNKSFMAAFESAFSAWMQHLQQKVQTDYQIKAGAPLEGVTFSGSSGGGGTFEFIIPDKGDLDIKTQEHEVWVPPTTYVAKDKSGRPTMRRRKGYKRKQKIELKDDESSPVREGGKQAQTGSGRWVVQQMFDYHIPPSDFADFLAKHISGKEYEVERIK